MTVRVLALLGAALLGLYFVPVTANTLGAKTTVVGSPGDPEPSEAAAHGASRPGEAVHAAGSAALLVLAFSGLLALFLRPEKGAHATHVIAFAAAMLLAVLLVGNPDNVGGQAGAVDPAFLILTLPALGAALTAAPWRAWRATRLGRPRLLGLAATGAVPAIWYGVVQALMQRNTYPPSADPHHNGHWFAMAVLAFALVLVLAGAAFSGRGWWVAASAAGLSATGLGVVAWLAPESASSPGPGWSALTALLGVATVVLVAAELRNRKEPSGGGSPRH